LSHHRHYFNRVFFAQSTPKSFKFPRLKPLHSSVSVRGLKPAASTAILSPASRACLSLHAIPRLTPWATDLAPLRGYCPATTVCRAGQTPKPCPDTNLLPHRAQPKAV